MAEKRWNPGEEVPETADYAAYDKNQNYGGTTHLEKGKRFPATQNPGSYYVKKNNKK